MKPLIVLLSTFIIAFIVIRFSSGIWQYAYAGQIAMSVMLLFTSIAHFKFADGMAMMVPGKIPYKKTIVWITAILEIALGVLLFFPSCRIITGWVIIAFFILILPANIYAAAKHINYEHADNEGKGPAYLWFRLPLQIFFIAWVYVTCIA